MPGALWLRAGSWEMEILPERGGRIRSLSLAGFELLDQGIGVDNRAADGFVEGGAWGWDEMVPTVEPAIWNGIALPDHGEAWRRPWSVIEAGESSCSMRCEGVVLPWRLDRKVVLGDSVRAEYVLTNVGEAAIPGYWCAHPLFGYEDGMEIDVGVRLMGFAAGKSGKLFLRPGEIDRARLVWRSGVGVEVAWDGALTPYCGVWVCNGDLGGYRQVAIEPATGGGDRPDSDEPPPTLEPGESLTWWLEIRKGTMNGV